MEKISRSPRYVIDRADSERNGSALSVGAGGGIILKNYKI